VIVSTWIPQHTAVLKVIQEMGLELHLIFNRAAVIVVPAGVNKASGMEYALRKLGLSRHEVVGVGDSENDHSFLQKCECPATVANAVSSIRKIAALVSKAPNGAGLAELIDELIDCDLCSIEGQLPQISAHDRPTRRQHACEHTSLWAKHSYRRTVGERKINCDGRNR
jgi:hypothetical protein